MANEKLLIDASPIIRDLTAMKSAYDAIALDGMIKALKEAPTVDAVEVVHGHWYEHHGFSICSHCQSMFDIDLKMLQVPSTWEMPNYCPHCGAKMDGGNDDG